MSLYKRKKTWWTDFAVNGQRYRQSLDTSDWREAQAKEKELIAKASEGKVAPSNQHFARLPFTDAAKQFLADRIPRLSPNSVRTERERWTPLFRYLGTLPVNRISAETIRGYIRQRKSEGIENSTINRELDVIRGVEKRAKRWHLMADEIRPLPVRCQVGRALGVEEKGQLLHVAAKRPEWEIIVSCATQIALNTTMRGCELKALMWRDVSLVECVVTVRRSKTEAGERVIPLNGDAMDAFLRLYRRAQAFGTEPNHYVFPACESGHIDSSRPQKSWRTAWRQIT